MSGAAIHKLLTAGMYILYNNCKGFRLKLYPNAVFITSLIGIFFSGISLAIGNRWSFVEIKNPTRDVSKVVHYSQIHCSNIFPGG